MAKKTTPTPQAVAPAQVVTSVGDATSTETTIEGVTATAEGNPMPPAMGNEGMAAAAGEGQPSLANPDPSRIPEDILALSEAIRAGSDATVEPALPPAGEPPADSAPSLIVTGPKKGRWRIGRKFGPEPVTLVAADLTRDELESLATDPTLTVTVVNAPF